MGRRQVYPQTALVQAGKADCIVVHPGQEPAYQALAQSLAERIKHLTGAALPVMADPDNTDAVVFLVSAPAKREKVVRVQVTLTPTVLHKIDATAAAMQVSRSAFLADAAMRAIKERERET